MAHFRGTLQGARGEASRLGGKGSGLSATAASWEGRVEVSLYYDESKDCDMARVCLTQHHGRGVYVELYNGPLNPANVEALKAAGPLKGEA